MTTEENSPKAESRKIIHWQQKLLDLSLRNRLLNTRDNQLLLPLVCKNIGGLEDTLSGNAAMKVLSLETLLGEEDYGHLREETALSPVDYICDVLHKELDDKQLWADVSEKELKTRLIKIYRQIQSDQNEGGINTLFMAVGFLSWNSPETKGKNLLAPLLLLPLRMSRRTIADGVTIRLSDEDPLINVTLLELLKQEFQMELPELSPLPMDDKGVDVPRILEIFRTAAQSMKGWEVLERAMLGQFSFGKITMWNDMAARQDDLLKNPIVSHLESGGATYDDGIAIQPPEETAAHADPRETYCPVSADASQLAAVKYSELGKSFVMHGPPGTGKSQTITNIIAHNLAKGRRVLFVSEKKAALDVVHHRLAKIGLQPFCLELHSNKAGKAGVLAQFREALDYAAKAAPGNWDFVIGKLEQSRKDLDDYVTQLHQVYPNGFSAYDCISNTLNSNGLRFPLEGHAPLEEPREQLEAVVDAVRQLATAFQDTTEQDRQILGCLQTEGWTPAMQDSLEALCRTGQEKGHAAATALEATAAPLGLALNEWDDLTKAEGLARLGAALGLPDIPQEFVNQEFAEKAPQVAAFVEKSGRMRELDADVASFHRDRLGDVDWKSVRRRLEENSHKFCMFKFFADRGLAKELGSLKKSGGGKLTADDLRAHLPALEEYARLQADVAAQTPAVKPLLGTLWQGADMDRKAVRALLQFHEKVSTAMAQLCGDDNGLKRRLWTAIANHSSELRNLFNTNALEKWTDFALWRNQEAARFDAEETPDTLSAFNHAMEEAPALLPRFRRLVNFKDQCRKATALGAGSLVAALKTKTLEPEAAVDALLESYLHTMLEQILAGSPVLARFVANTHEAKIRHFQQLEAQYMQLTRELVVAKLSANLPAERDGKFPLDTEMGRLRRECEKKTRHLPVRALLAALPKLAPALKPCFLMSPLSVAQYLPPDSADFDLIVFDEASQIPVWDAIGVIARSKQLIVVGDPKQMPPTSFFQKNEASALDADATEEEPEVEDMESILDECLVAGLPSTFLSWHYRSRHESLIAFSNEKYYGNRLATFPAASDSANLGVSFVHVPEGVYDRRGSRTNIAEGKAIIACLERRFADPQLAHKSVGIVTFSQTQKELIEDLLEEMRAAHPEFEELFNEKLAEPPFVKNLENVQGDERDAILFSVGYGPDKDGKFAMNFGPLNQTGGERRLNVAITRAKEQVIVFSSIHGSQIDLSRTSAVGAAHLKAFLDYAEKGMRKQAAYADDAPHGKNGLADAACDLLQRHGYTVHRNIGRSGYKIDVGVMSPTDANQFVVGIECDGDAYAALPTTRDRELGRFSVLNNLGWNMIRLWSAEWFADRASAEAKLLQEVAEAIQGIGNR